MGANRPSSAPLSPYPMVALREEAGVVAEDLVPDAATTGGRRGPGVRRDPPHPGAFDRVTVIVAEDDPHVRDAVVDVLSNDDRIDVVAVATDAVEAVRVAQALQPDVALLDLKMPGGGGIVAIGGILQASPRTKTLALTAYEEPAVVLRVLRAGAIGYLVKGSRPEDLVDGVIRAARGEAVVDEALAHGVLAELDAETDPPVS